MRHAKILKSKNLEIQISEDKKVGCLLWMDNVLLITDDVRTIQHNHITEFGQTKSQTQIIGKREKFHSR